MTKEKSMTARTVSRFTLALLTASCLVPAHSFAQVDPANGATSVYTAPNGVPIVDIANPNSSGLSHNKYNNYNVDKKGLVLNNGDTSEMERQSQLAGAVPSNLHLTKSASVILNEVVTTNRSSLKGFTEVVGQSADVIVANPNGITCDGCGFINTPRASLITGTPMLSGAGALNGFHVDNGDILITGDGLDGTQSDYLSLIGRSVKLEAQVNAKALEVIAGANDYDYATKGVTANAPAGAAPTLAIDSSALGGMYADRIRLVATEAGVGVKMLGNAAAGVGDFTIDSTGKVQIDSQISAKQDLKITSTASGADTVKTNNASLTADRDIAVTAASGEVHLTGGSLKATRDLGITSASLTDAATSDPDADNNKRYAEGDVTLTQTGAVSLNGTSFGAGNLLNLDSDSLSIGGAGETLYGDTLAFTTAHNMSLGLAGLQAESDLALTSTAGSITTSSGAGQGVKSAAGDITVSANNGLTNGGALSADAGDLILHVLGSFTNGGSMHAHGAINIADYNAAGTEDFTNSGTLLADDTLTFLGHNLTNSGSMQGTKGSTLTLTGLTNSGTMILSDNTANSGTINADTIANNGSGIIQSKKDMTLNILTSLNNQSSAQVRSTGDMTMRGRANSSYDVRTSGLINAGGMMNIKGFGGNSLVNIYTDAGTGDYIADSMDIRAGTISLADNSGLTSQHGMAVYATTGITSSGSGAYIVGAKAGTTGAMTIDGLGTFNSTAKFYSGTDLTVNANNIGTSGTGLLGAHGTLTLNASGGDINNFGQLYAGTLISAQTTGNGDFYNRDSGQIDSDGNFTVVTDRFENNNNVDVAGNMTITANQFYNQPNGGDKRVWNYGTATTTHTGWSSDPDWLVWGQSANDYYTRTWTDYQSYSTAPTHHPMLIANGTLRIQNFQYGLNLGGIISANNLQIASSVGGASFTNDAYSLETRNYTNTWYSHVSCCSDVIYLDYSYNQGDTTSHTSSYTTYGGALYANSFTGTGFSLTNVTSPYGSASVSNSNPAGGTNTGSSAGSVTVGGLTITLPTNPNGKFILSLDPNSRYLIETNPLFSVGSAFLGSDYMLKRYGVDPDSVQRRLGDAGYEADLIRKQLLDSGAGFVVAGSDDPAAMMQKLMDNGADTGKELGLTIGKAPTAEQIASLKGDMVWMVETEVNGQKVLAPVVYLSSETKSQIASGAVIQTNNANLQLASLTNTGGTIEGKNSLNVTSQGDITNTSGKIKGGDVSLTSTEGSIVNQTTANTSGGEGNQHTDIGDTASIEATGNLNLDAKKDITNKGADMSAGGDASLKAGNNITFDTVEDKESSATHSGQNNSLTGGTYESTTTSTTTNKKSGLTVGGNLKTDSGNDTTFAGTDVNVGGNADINAGGDLNVIARNDSAETTTSSKSGTVFSGSSHDTHDKQTTNVGSNFNVGGNLNSKSGGDTTIQGSNIDVKGDGSIEAGGDLKILDGQNTSDHSESNGSTGLGVGGGVYGTSTTTDRNEKGTSVASNLNFGGNGSLKSGNDITVQGSNVTSGGDLGLDAKNDVKILEGRNTETNTHTEETTTFGKIDMGDGYEAPEEEEEPAEEKGGVNAHAEAKASAEDENHGGVTLSQTDIDSTTHHTDKASSSNIKSGGNMTVKAGNDITVRGSNVEAGGNADIDAKNVNVLAAEDIDTTTNSHTTAKVGLYGSTKNEAGAEAEANAHAQADGEGAPEASADASAGAHASTENTLDLVRVDESTKTTTDVTHTDSSIKSGGNMNVTADNKLNVNGSEMESGGDMNLKAKDMSFTAANDSHTESSTDSHTRAGLYADAGTEANASAGVNAAGASAGGNASVDASADAGVGLYGSNTTNSNTSGSTTAKTSSIKSGGNMTRTAENNITDEGTQIDAGGDFTQDSKTWDSKAAKDTTFDNSSSESNKAKFGLYAEANAGASGGASTTDGVENDSGADASVGLSASYNRKTSDSSSDSSHAVVSNIKSGGNMKTTTTEKTSLEGTNLASGGDMELNAGSLDYKAAQDTESSSKGSTNIDAGGKIGIDATKAVTGSVEGGYGSKDSSESSTHGVAGSMTSGGNMKVNTKGDANFEGTNLDAGGDASVKAGGDVNFKAAHDTHESSEENIDVSASLSASKNKSKGKSGAGFKAEGSYDTSESSSDTANAGSIKSGGNLDISSGKNATFEGTKMEAGGDANIDAKGDVNFNAAKSTESSSGWGVSASVGGSTEKDKKGSEKKGSVGLGGSYNESDSLTSDAASLKSGGKVNVKAGNDMNLEGTNIESGGSTTLDADRDVNFKAAENTSHSVDFSAEIGGETSKKQETGKAAEKEKGGKIGLGISGGDSSTKTGGSIKSGSGITVKSGNDTNLEGTRMESAGDTSIAAGGDVNMTAAKSTDIHGGFGGGVGSKGGGVTKLSIGGGETNEGVQIKSGGDANISSGGKTVMEGTQVEAEGNANVDAKGGVEKSTNVSGGANLGFDHAGVDLDIQETKVEGKGNTQAESPELKEVMTRIDSGKDTAPPSAEQNNLQSSIDTIKNDKSLSPEVKEQKLAIAEEKLKTQKAIDKVKNDPNLTKGQKDKLLKELSAKQKALGE